MEHKHRQFSYVYTVSLNTLGDSLLRQIVLVPDHFIWVVYPVSDKANKCIENDEWKAVVTI